MPYRSTKQIDRAIKRDQSLWLAIPHHTTCAIQRRASYLGRTLSHTALRAGKGILSHTYPWRAHRSFACVVIRCHRPREFVFISTVGRRCFDSILTLSCIIKFLSYLLFVYNNLIRIRNYFTQNIFSLS